MPPGPTIAIAIGIIIVGGAVAPTDTESDTTTPDAGDNADAADPADPATSDGVSDANANDNADQRGAAGEPADRADRSAEAAAESVDQLLHSQGHPSASVEVSSIGDNLIVSYHSDAATERQLAGEIGTFAAVYAAVVADDYDVGDMVVVVSDSSSGDIAGRYSVMKEWARDYNNGVISQEEFAYRILNTVSAADHRAPGAASAPTPA